LSKGLDFCIGTHDVQICLIVLLAGAKSKLNARLKS
jgi:hypothetical protein